MTNPGDRTSAIASKTGQVPGVVWLLILACLLPELVLFGADLGLWGTQRWRQVAFQYGGFWLGLLGNWRPNFAAQPYTMFASYGFLHAGLAHFLVNMATLLSIGTPLARASTPGGFLLLYGLSLLGGAVGFAALSSSVAPMIGASGALFGLVGALLAQDFSRRSARSRSLVPVFQAIAGLIVLNVVLWWAMNGQLAWQTHLGGFVAGWLFTMIAIRKRA